jgi:hypothetical protein
MQPELYVLEHSCSQGCFHVGLLTASLKSNLAMYRSGKPNDYVPLAAGTEEEVRSAAETIAVLRAEREEFERTAA